MSLWTRLLGRRDPPQTVDINAIMEAGRETGYLQALTENWQTYTGFDTGTEDTTTSGTPERDAYDTQPAFTAAIDNLLDLTLGNGPTYGELTDATAYTALQEWYALNDLQHYTRTILQQYLLDGEILALLATDGPRNAPAWVNLWDTRVDTTKVNTAPGNPRLVTSIEVGQRTVTPDAFALRRHNAAFNRTRGRSPLATAVQPAVNYTRLLTLRVRAHEIRGRLNLIYYAFAKTLEELKVKAGRYLRLPRDGNVITLQVDPDTGQSEKLDVVSAKADAADAESDLRAHIRTVAMVAGIPEHFMAIGDTANLATAKAMSEPMIRRIEGHQELVTGVLAELFQKELKRRFGKDRLYAVTRITVVDGERSEVTEYVTADNLDIPFSLPPVRNEEGTDLEAIKYAHEQGLISDQTTIEELGFDPALEAERKMSDTEDGPDPETSEGDGDAA